MRRMPAIAMLVLAAAGSIARDSQAADLFVDPWDWYNDAFPANESPGFPGVKALFDTTAARVKTGRNIAALTGNRMRRDVPGDTVVVQSATSERVDMIFRILPGPGNYQPVGQGHSGCLRAVPSATACVVSGDGSFWDVYRRVPGQFSTNPAGMTDLKAGWNPNFWLSARCDTAEINLFAQQGAGILGGPPVPTTWMSAYHEGDLRPSMMGASKPRCFHAMDPPTPAIVCGAVPAWAVPSYDPAGPAEVPGSPGFTREFVKIIPDGLLTPGSHVEYFFRDIGPNPVLLPDTNVVSPQIAEGSEDGHRWQEFSILPDRWKDPQYIHPVLQRPGRGPACLLVVDFADGRGDERVWVSVADTAGATSPEKWGAHNGWHARGGGDINDPAGFTSAHIGHPGTTWDFYQVRGSGSAQHAAGSLGSRLAFRGAEGAEGASSKQGPTPDMMAAYYTLMLLLSGDLNSGILGPYANHSQDDVALIKSWLLSGSWLAPNRGIWAIGDGFVESNWFEPEGADPPNGGGQYDLLSTYFGVQLVDPSYRIHCGVFDNVLDFFVLPEWLGQPPPGYTFGVRNSSISSLDVLQVDGIGINLGSVASEYRPKGGGCRATAGVFKDWDPSSPWKALVDGAGIQNLTTRNDSNTLGRIAYFHRVFSNVSNVWNRICDVVGTKICPLSICTDVPGWEAPGALADYFTVLNNPVLSGETTLRFGLAAADRVQARVYDVAGRLVRLLADRQFGAGEHRLVWDGLDNGGRRLPRGVYFARIKYGSNGFKAGKKITFLR